MTSNNERQRQEHKRIYICTKKDRGSGMKFTKIPTAFQQQIALLKNRGLIIKNSKKALQNIAE